MTVTDIESLITFGLAVFAQVFVLFKHPTTPVPTSSAPAIIQTLHNTPGITEDHKVVITNSVNAAAAEANKSNVS